MAMAMAPAAQQIAHLISMLFMLTSLGIPLSMPPAPEDPFLSRIAPEHCIYYSRWAGIAQPEADGKNQIDQLFRDPEVRRFVKELDLRARRMAMLAGQQGNTNQAVVADAGVTLGTLMLTQPMAIFVSEVRTDPPAISGGAVMKLGEHQQQVERVLERLLQTFPAEAVTRVEIEGKPFWRAAVAQGTQFTWGIRDDYLMLGLGDDAITQIIERSRTPEPDWLRQSQAENELPRRATFTYADLGALTAVAVESIDDEEFETFAQSTGLLELKSYVSVTGLDEVRFVSRTKVETIGPPTGLLAAIKGQPLREQDLAAVPADALVAAVANFDLNHLLDVVMNFLRETEPHNASQIEQMLGTLQQQTGVDLTEDVFGSLGPCWRIYTTSDEGGLVSGWVVSVDVKDLEALQDAQQKLLAPLPAGADLVRAVQWNGKTVYSAMLPPGFPFSPSWSISDNKLIVGLFPQAVRRHLVGGDPERSLAQVPEVQQQLQAQDAPTAMTYLDTPQLIRIAYPMIQVSLQVFGGVLRREGLVDLDASFLPTTTALCRHARPSVMTARAVDHGVVFQSHHSLPGGNLGTVAPLMTAGLLPGLHSAKLAAEQAQGINNLRQIMLATINFESTYGHFPAAYSADENGKPLLSWRVHILPFTEEQQLYQQFRLDEPWDSPHNRKLIPQMPQVYRAPGSKADPGKTVYLAVRDERGVIVPAENIQGQRTPQGIRIRTVTDGLSKTVVVLEASDHLAVIWTKPDDLVPNEKDPINGLVGQRQNGFLAGFGDGHVSVIPSTIPRVTLKALFTRNGGEVTEGF